MAEKRTTLKELIQDIDYRLTHLEDISADNRALIVKMVKQGNQIVEFLRRFDVEDVQDPMLEFSLDKQQPMTQERENRMQSLKELLDDYMEKHQDLKEFEKELKKHKDDITPGTIGES